MVTRKEVAKKAGVSVTIVSRTLNNSGYVAKIKKEAVLKAAKELGYRPNPIALSLQSKRTNQILFYTKDLGNSFNIDLYRGMVHYARQVGYMIVLSGTLDFEKIKTMMIDGIILPNESMSLEYVKILGDSFNIPTVSASYGAQINNPKHIPFIESDTFLATEMLISYLQENGHTKIALATPYQINVLQPRQIAYVGQMRPILGDKIDEYVINGIAFDDVSFEEEDFYEHGVKLADLFYKRKSDATAIVCFNDELALGMCNKLKAMGVNVPEDVSVVGIDGIGASKYVTPALTTVDISPFKQGEECVRVLLDMIDGKKVKCRTQIPINLVEGGSVKTLK